MDFKQQSTTEEQFYYDEEKGVVKPFEEISKMVEWVDLSPEDKLNFIHTHIKPEYLREQVTESSSTVRFKKSPNTSAAESEEEISNRQETERTEQDRGRWTIEYENLLRQKIFWELKYRIEEHKGGKRKVKFLERNLIDLQILQATNLESILLTSMIKSELDYWKKSEDESDEKIQEENKPIRLKWNATPSVFGYLITELVNKGFIEAPLHSGETNYTGLAKLCYSIFDTGSTLENIIKEINPNKSSLSDVKRAKFTIPDLSDLL